MLRLQDEQTLALHGWVPFGNVYPNDNVLLGAIAHKYYGLPLNEETSRSIIIFSLDYFQRINHPCIHKGIPTLEVWNPPGTGICLLVIKRKTSTNIVWDPREPSKPNRWEEEDNEAANK